MLRGRNALKGVGASKITSYTSALIPGATCGVAGVLRDTYLQRFWESFDSLAQDSSADVAFRFEVWLSALSLLEYSVLLDRKARRLDRPIHNTSGQEDTGT